LNWNSAWFSRRCLSALEATDYPAEYLELVLVDNASVDGSLELLRYAFPNVRVIANERNLGFAEGCNRAMRDLSQVDAVALVNNDAVPEPGWLWPLVEGLQSDPTVGAVAAGLVLEPEFTRVGLRVTGGQAQIESLSIGPISVLDRSQSTGMWSVGHSDWPMDLDYFVDGSAALLVPAGPGERLITLRARGVGTLVVSTAFDQAQIQLGPDPAELQLRAGDDRTELLNGLGTDLRENSEGYDRHFGEPAQMLSTVGSETVLGFCGGGVLLRTAMLNQVGLFDPRLFAYYEDTDLAWRARRAGWHTVTAPASVIRHAFGASAASASPGFFVHVYRNWMMTVLRNATSQERRLALRSIWDRMKWAVRANVFSRLKHGRLPRTKLVLAWKQVVWDSLIELRYVHKTRDQNIGAVSTNKLRSPLRPSSGARPPTSRPGGPLIVYLDIQQNNAAATCLLTQLPLIESRIDLVAVVRDLGSPSGYRRASAGEMQVILGLQGRAIESDTDVLRLAEFAIGSVLLNCEKDRITAKPATKSLLQGSLEDAVQQGKALSEVALQLPETESIPRVHLGEFVKLLIARFGLP
jgi:GT2 family glycosyltransferase